MFCVFLFRHDDGAFKPQAHNIASEVEAKALIMEYRKKNLAAYLLEHGLIHIDDVQFCRMCSMTIGEYIQEQKKAAGGKENSNATKV